MPDHDILVVGAGHNGLVCACYLAQSGKRVLVLERRDVVGGAVCTEEIIPGFRFDVGSSAHIMIKSTPIIEELGLEEMGLDYIEMDPWAFYPLPDGQGGGICFYRDVEKTVESIRAVSAQDAEAYRRYVEHWTEINEGVWDVFLKPPTPGKLFGTIFKRNLLRPKSRKLWSSMETVRQLMMPYGRLIDETFESPEMRSAMGWLAAQSGPPPTELASGDLFGWNAMIHKIGAWRARGGSGALTVALRRRLEALGGEVITGAKVTRIGKEQGAFEVETESSETHTARAVVAACHVQETFLDLLDDELCPAELKQRVSKVHVGNGFGMVVRHAVEELPHYPGVAIDPATGSGECHHGLQLLCPSTEYLEKAYLDFAAGRPAEDPVVLAMTFSAIDPSLAPEGKHVLFSWSQYQPYELAEGGAARWDEIAEEYADKIYDVVCRYAPNMRGKEIGRYVQTPLEIERKLALRRGNVMHVEMSIDQMFAFRPLPELSTYRTPIDGLYLTGASTHPGGGVFGASGRNTAMVVRKDL